MVPKLNVHQPSFFPSSDNSIFVLFLLLTFCVIKCSLLLEALSYKIVLGKYVGILVPKRKRGKKKKKRTSSLY